MGEDEDLRRHNCNPLRPRKNVIFNHSSWSHSTKSKKEFLRIIQAIRATERGAGLLVAIVPY